MVVGSGEEALEYEFAVYNGSKGSTGDKGEQGDKGVKGDTGIAIYNTDVNDLIYDDSPYYEEMKNLIDKKI